MKKDEMHAIKGILKEFDWDKKKYISKEFQDYGFRLSEMLGDLKHKALYMKLAKETPRYMLEEAVSFVKNANNVKNPARLFMWKLGQLKKAPKKHLLKS
ncbi:MAG: hypothetical protein ABIH88_00885 [Patescibacteria group bacterium]|nr:hypothetical protein [Patescibacteria group bacterium]